MTDPKTEEDLAQEWFNWFATESQDYEWHALASITVEQDLVLLHHSFGRSIRNHNKLWERSWTPEIDERGCDISPNHPDAVSMRILTGVWQRIKQWESLKQ